MNFIRKDLINIQNEINEIRKDLHKIPEKGFNEKKTNSYISKYLDDLGVEYENIAKTGIIAILKGKDSSDIIAYRTDMDGLGIVEENQIDFASTHNGMMHACGHDGHMAMALGIIKYIKEKGVKLERDIAIIFQPAEEGPGGAEVIIKEGVLERYNIKQIFAYHVFPEIEEGYFSTKNGPIMAKTGEFDVEIFTKGAHGAMPHKSMDAAVLAAELLMKFQTIVSRNIDPIEPVVLTVGKLNSGQQRNVISNYSILEGTIRAFDEDVHEKIKKHVYKYAKDIEDENVKVKISFTDMYPAVVNDENMANEFKEVIGKERFVLSKPQMIAEDFSYYQNKIEGVFVFLGTKNNGKGYNYPLHSSKFNFSEKVLLYGIEGFLRYLQQRGVMDDR